jgi:hypothetical protein
MIIALNIVPSIPCCNVVIRVLWQSSQLHEKNTPTIRERKGREKRERTRRERGEREERERRGEKSIVI